MKTQIHAEKDKIQRVGCVIGLGRHLRSWAMIDTPHSVEKLYESMIMRKSPEERLRMGCSMFKAAQEIVLASIRDQDPGLSPKEIKKQLFLRFYDGDFPDSQKARILLAIQKG